MKHLLTLIAATSLVACTTADQEAVASDNTDVSATTLQLTSADFKPLVGEGWTGQLTYLDYTSEKMESIPVGLNVKEPKGRTLKYTIIYPGETQYNSTEKISISRDGTKVDGKPITSRAQNESGLDVTTTEYKGEDNGQPAMIRMSYEVGTNEFRIGKYVKFDDAEEYFKRSEYKFER